MSASDPVTLRELLAHREWVRGFAAALVRDPADADDLAQDAWTSALRSPPGSGTPVRAWFAAVMRNRVRDRFRHERLVAERAREAAQDDTTGTSPAELAERAEIERRVLAIVLELEEPFRDTVLLRFWRAMTPADIAALRGIPAATVRTRLHRALAEVRRRLDEGDARGRWRAVLLPVPLDRGSTIGLTAGGAAMAVSSKWIVAAIAAAFLLLAGVAVVRRPWVAAAPEEVVPPAGPPPAAEVARKTPVPGRASPQAVPPAGNPAAVVQSAAPAASVQPLSAVVAVLVTDPDGRPVAGAEVFALMDTNAKGAKDAVLPAHSGVRTGADGSASLPWPSEPGPGRVLARTPELAGVSASVAIPSKDAVAVQLETAFVVAGRVEDDASRPITGASLALEADLGGGMESFARATSEADGRFRFLPLPGSFRESSGAVAAAASGFATEWVMLKEEGRDAAALVLVLRRAMVLSGRVVDEAGRPVGDVTVECSTGDNVFTGADGRFRTGPLRPQEVRIGILPDEHGAVALRVKDATPGERELGDVVVRAGAALRGRVERPDGSAAAGAWVGVEDTDVGQIVRQAMTDAAGRFAFEHLGPGALTVQAHDAPDGPFAGAAAKRPDVRAGGDDVVLTLSAGRSVLVQVVDAETGEPVKADFVVVNIRPEGSAPAEAGATTLFDTRDGRTALRVRSEKSGPHLVTVRVRGFAEYGPERTDVSDDGGARVVAKLVREAK